jgi:hypothetical protein
LRQRRIEMPTTMANLWLGTGAVVIVILLMVAALLPRPSAEYAISRLPVSLGSPSSDSSRFAPVPREAARDEQPGEAPARAPDDDSQAEDQQGESRPAAAPQNESQGSNQDLSAKSSEAGKSSSQQGKQTTGSGGSKSARNQSAPADKAATNESNPLKSRIERIRDTKAKQSQHPPTDARQQPGDSENQNDQSKEPPREQARRGGPEQESKESQENASQNPQATQPAVEVPPVIGAPLGFLAQLAQWAFYAAFVMAAIYFLWRFRADVLRAIRDFWDGLWGRRRPRGAMADSAVEITIPPAPFSTYADPFAAGVAARYPLGELVRYSFEAFEAWSREHGCPREPEVTPHELARDVGKLNKHIAADARNLAELYARAAYARGDLPDSTRDQLQSLWQSMRRATVGPRLPS